MLLEDWLARRALFFGGKGGVGKTTCASAFALWAARRGKKTLLLSTDPAHSVADILEMRLGDRAREVVSNLFALEIDPERAAADYIDKVRADLLNVVSPRMREELVRQVEMAKVSPGAEEAALFDRLAAILQETDGTYDLVVFDTAPTGHTLRLLSLPELMQAWIDGLLHRRRQARDLQAMWRHMTVGGSEEKDVPDPVERALVERRRKFYQARKLLLDNDATAFVFVVTPERLPILETEKAVKILGRHGVPIGGLIVNRVLPEVATTHAFFAARKAQQTRYLEEITRTFGALERIELPLLDRDVVGHESLERIVEALVRRT